MPKYQTTVQLVDVKLGKNSYWLEFKAFADSMDKNKKYKIEFCGTEMTTTLSLSGEREDLLRNGLLEDYGYGPYKLADMKEKLKKHHCYYL